VRAIRPFGQWLLTASLLLAHLCAQAQPSRVDTRVQLQMTDVPVGGQAAATNNAGQLSPAAASARNTRPTTASKGSGPSLYLTSGLKFDDNVLRRNRHEERDVIVVMRPAIYFDGRLGRHSVRAGYEADIERYLSISALNMFNQKLLVDGDLDLGRRLQASLGSALEYGTDRPGDLDTRPRIRGRPDRWREHSAAAEITLGRRIAQAQVGFRSSIRGLRYLNNNQHDRDFDERRLKLFGRYNLGVKYAVVTTLSGAWVDYLDPRSDFDSREYRGLAGLEWEATAKTSGTIMFGLRHRDFYAHDRSSNDGFIWDARAHWSPKTYSRLTAYSARNVSEGGFIGGVSDAVTISDTLGLIWRHGLSERMTFEAQVERTLARADGRDDDDEFMLYGAELRYQLNRSVDVFADWEFRSRSSRTSPANYEATSVFIGIDVRLDQAFGH